MDMDTGRWVPAGEVDANTEKFTVDGLTPKKKYKFRVKAVNKEGESEPLESEEPITAKNPYGMPLSIFLLIYVLFGILMNYVTLFRRAFRSRKARYC